MKSLNFQKLNLQKEDFLTKTQMKNILGGYGNGGPCYYNCSTTETYADGSTYTYELEISSENTTAKHNDYKQSVVDNGYATSCTGTCDTSVPCHE